MNIYESAEDYLEAILMIKERKGYVRSVDIADELQFSKASVSVAMKNLREKGHITVSEEGFLRLTDSGRAIAEMIRERHQLLTMWSNSI